MGDRIVNQIKDVNKGIKIMNDGIRKIDDNITNTSKNFFHDIPYEILHYNGDLGQLRKNWIPGSGFIRLMSDMNNTRSEQLDHYLENYEHKLDAILDELQKARNMRESKEVQNSK